MNLDCTDGKLLLIDDDPGTLILQRRTLERAGHPVCTASTMDEAKSKLETDRVALLLLDNKLLGEKSGVEHLEDSWRECGNIPVILVTGFSDETTVIRALRAGVKDFIVKTPDYLALLPERVRLVLDQVRTERELAAARTQLQEIVSRVPDVLWTATIEESWPLGRTTFVSPACRKIYGREPAEFLDDPDLWTQVILPEDRARVLSEAHRGAQERERRTLTYRIRRKGGEIAWIEDSIDPILDGSGRLCAVQGLARDVTVRHRAEEERTRLQSIIEATPDLVGYADPTTLKVRYINPAGRRLLGLGVEDDLSSSSVYDFHPASSNQIIARTAVPQALAQGHWEGEIVFQPREGAGIATWMTMVVPRAPGGEPDSIAVICRDLSAQRALECQFRQAQKMELVGQLAGGVAHDFNNILAVILGYTGLLLADITPDDPNRTQLEAMHRAAMRAAGLTRQLLAFSRRQVLQTSVFDLNALTRDMEKMLRRLIPENVHLEVITRQAPDRIRADAGQVEQVLMNLVVNARDAIQESGIVVIQTSRAELAEGSRELRHGGKPGPHVELRVTDTGTGMDAATQARIFEPFFTTKEAGKGTGLGLSTVEGIVKQSGGFITLSSSPGHGTTFRVFFPLTDEPVADPVAPQREQVMVGPRTILLVEDEEDVRALAGLILRRSGYEVLEAAGAKQAQLLAEQRSGSVDLLLTDVVLAGVSGRELARRLSARFSQLRVLFMSGYTDDVTLCSGILASDVPFLQKPFTAAALKQRVAEVLARPRVPVA